MPPVAEGNGLHSRPVATSPYECVLSLSIKPTCSPKLEPGQGPGHTVLSSYAAGYAEKQVLW